MSKPRSRHGRATPKKHTETAARPPTRSDLMAATEPMLQRLFGDYVPLHSASPLEAELRASLVWSIINDDRESFQFVIQSLRDRLQQGRADARDALRLLSTVVDRPLAARFNEMLRQSPVAGLPPAWINQAGRAAVERAMLFEQETGDVDTLLLVCRYPEAASQHAIAVLFDRNVLHAVRNIDVSVDYRDEDDVPEGFTRRDIEPAEARARIERGLKAATLFAPERTGSVAVRGVLLEHYAHKLPEGFELPERRPRTDDEIATLVDEVVASGAAAPREVLTAILTRAANLFDDPLHFTALSIEVLSVAMRDEIGPDPAVYGDALRAIARFAHDRNGWGDRYLDAARQAIDEVVTAARAAAPDPAEPPSRAAGRRGGSAPR